MDLGPVVERDDEWAVGRFKFCERGQAEFDRVGRDEEEAPEDVRFLVFYLACFRDVGKAPGQEDDFEDEDAEGEGVEEPEDQVRRQPEPEVHEEPEEDDRRHEAEDVEREDGREQLLVGVRACFLPHVRLEWEHFMCLFAVIILILFKKVSE